jgi:hypothetical protein
MNSPKWLGKEWKSNPLGVLNLAVTALGAILIPLLLLGIQNAISDEQQSARINFACSVTDSSPASFEDFTLLIAAQCTADNLSQRKVTLTNFDTLLYYGNVSIENHPALISRTYPSTDKDFDIKTKLPYTLDQSQQLRFKAILNIPLEVKSAEIDKLQSCAPDYVRLAVLNACVGEATKTLIPNHIYDGRSGFNGIGARLENTDATINEIRVSLDDLAYVTDDKVPELSQHRVDRSCWIKGLSESEKNSSTSSYTQVCGNGSKVLYIALLYIAPLVLISCLAYFAYRKFQKSRTRKSPSRKQS